MITVPAAWTAFTNIWVVDFEFQALEGECPHPICCVARNIRTGALQRLWDEDLARPAPPYGLTDDDLVVAYFASAEMSCHLQLRWPLVDTLSFARLAALLVGAALHYRFRAAMAQRFVRLALAALLARDLTAMLLVVSVFILLMNAFLAHHRDDLGRRGTVDLREMYD